MTEVPGIESNQDAVSFFEKWRWRESGGRPYCPGCGSAGSQVRCRRLSKLRQKTNNDYWSEWRCNSCKKHYTVFYRSVFTLCRTPPMMLASAVYQITASRKKNHPLVHELADDLEIHKHTAYALKRRILVGRRLGYWKKSSYDAYVRELKKKPWIGYGTKPSVQRVF